LDAFADTNALPDTLHIHMQKIYNRQYYMVRKRIRYRAIYTHTIDRMICNQQKENTKTGGEKVEKKTWDWNKSYIYCVFAHYFFTLPSQICVLSTGYTYTYLSCIGFSFLFCTRHGSGILQRTSATTREYKKHTPPPKSPHSKSLKKQMMTHAHIQLHTKSL